MRSPEAIDRVRPRRARCGHGALHAEDRRPRAAALGRRAPRRRELVRLPRVPPRRPGDGERRAPSGARDRDRPGGARRAGAHEPRRGERGRSCRRRSRGTRPTSFLVSIRTRRVSTCALGIVARRPRRPRDRRHRDVAGRLPPRRVRHLEGGARPRGAGPAVDAGAGARDRRSDGDGPDRDHGLAARATPTPSTSSACCSRPTARRTTAGSPTRSSTELIERARQERSDRSRLELFHEADRMAVADRIACIPLVYGRSMSFVKPWVTGWWEFGKSSSSVADLMTAGATSSAR